jgi:O-antigen/teichoic acid export membrane protein
MIKAKLLTNMSEKITNIAKNTSYFTIALIIQKIISFSYFTIYARELGPEDLGKFYFAISFATIFAVIMDIGLANVLIREIAKTPERASILLRNILAIKIPLAIFSWLVIIICAHLLDYDGMIRDLIYVSSLCVILDSFTTVFFSSIRGFHNLKYESISSVGFSLVILVTSLIVLRFNLGLVWLMYTLLIASLLNFIYSAIINVLKFKVNILPKWEQTMVKKLFVITIPFALYIIFQKAYTSMDTILLKELSGDTAVGLYQIPFKIVMALQFLPAAFIASVYPAMSSYWKNNHEQLVIIFERSINYLIIIALPITVGVIVLADKIMLLFKSTYSYDAAILPVQMVMIALFFMFLATPVGALLNACDRQKKNTINMLFTAIFSIALNIILIPYYGVLGASITLTASSILLLILGWRYVHEIIDYHPTKIIKVFGKALLAAIVMVIVVLLLKNSINIFVLTVIGALIYFILLFLQGGFNKQDITSIIQSFQRK